MQRVNTINLSPRRLLQNIASPQGPLPPGDNARGAAESNRIAGVKLLTQTFNQINTSRLGGVGGRLDLLG